VESVTVRMINQNILGKAATTSVVTIKGRKYP